MNEHASRERSPEHDAQPAPQDAHDQINHDSDDTDAQAWAPMQQYALAKALGRDERPLRERVTAPASELPYRAQLERTFGESLAGVQAHLGERNLLSSLGGEAAADGNVIAFRDSAPTLQTVAHEVTHVLQARNGKVGGHAEAEAQDIEARVSAGESAGAIKEGASGLHLKDESSLVDARAFLREMISVSSITYHTLYLNKSLETHPYAPYIRTPEVLLDSMFGWGAPGAYLTKPFEEKIEGMIAPAQLVPLVNNARKADTPAGGTVAGPAHYVFMDSVGLALGNALTRSLRQSVTRMLPRYVAAVRLEPDADGKLQPTATPLPHALPVSHPLDRIVALGMCSPTVGIDAAKYAEAHPDLIKAEQKRQNRNIQVKFAWERNLWHWVEAPVDATAEEVAQALFGAEDQAYRLTPMAPLFGFRSSDVEAFTQKKRDELNELAKLHHPSPAVLNWIDIAQYDRQKAEQAKTSDSYYSGDAMDGGVPPIAGVPDVPSNEPDPNRPREVHGFPAEHDVDPAVELAAEMGDRLAMERAKAAAADGKQYDEKSVYDRIDDCLENLRTTQTAFTTLALSTEAVERHIAQFKGRQRQTLETCLADPNGAYALADQQAKVLKRLATGASDTTAYLGLFGGVSAKDSGPLPSPRELPDTAREPIEEAANMYASALDALAFPELATPRLDKADSLQKTLRITILENSIYRSEGTLHHGITSEEDRHKDGAKYDLGQKLFENNSLLAELSVLRVQMESEPAAAEKQLGDTQTRAGDYLFEMSVIANFEALDRVWKLVNDEHDFWEDLDDTARGWGLEAQNRGYYTEFLAIYKRYDDAVKAKNDDEKKAAREAFKALVDRKDFQDHFKKVKDHLEDVASSKKWNKIIAGIAIAIVAMALGQVYFGALLAETGSVLLASLGAAAVETTTNVILSKLVLDVDPTAGNLITGFVGSGLMYGVLGRALMAGRAAGVAAEVGEGAIKVNAAVKVGTWVANTGKEMIFAQAIGLLQAQIAAMIDGTQLTEEQIRDMLVHNVAGVIGMKIGQRVVDHTLDPLKPLRQLGARNGIDVKGLLDEKNELESLAETVKDTRDPALAQELIDRERAFLERERDVRDKLVEHAQKHPEHVSAEQLRDLEAMPDRSADAEVVQARAFMSLEEVGPGFYRADARAFDALVEMHQKSNDRLVGVETDPATSLRTMRFETPEGLPIRIKEKLLDIPERTGPPIPVDEALKFEQWLENEATVMIGPDAVDQLRRYYASDPRAAVKLGQKYGYQSPFVLGEAPLESHAAPGMEHPAAKVNRSDSERAYEHYASELAGKEIKPGEPPPMDRSVFDSMYKSGYEWDPIAQRWVPGEKLPPTVDPPTRDLDRIRNGPEGKIRNEAELNNADVAYSMNEQLQSVKPSEVGKIIDRFTPDQQAKARVVLAKATGYGNMEALNSLRKAMAPHLGAGLKLYTPGHGSLADNMAYLNNEKHVFGSVGHNDRVPTTNTIGPDTLVILDDVLLHKIKTEPGFAKQLADNNAFLLEPRGFNSGINMYNAMSPDVVAQRTSQLLDRANDIQAKSNGKVNFDQAVNTALDEATREALNSAHSGLGEHVKAVDAASHPDVTDAAIAKQLNGEAGVTEAQIDAVMTRVPDQFRGFLRELMARQAQVFSPRRQSNEIVAAQQRVLAVAGAKGVDPSNIYYYIQKSNKSFGLLAMAHREATGTPVDRYINGPSDLAKVGPGKDKLVVVLDDVAGSGDTLVDVAETSPHPKNTNVRKAGFEGEVVVVPIRSTEFANERFMGKGGLVDQDPHLTYSPGDVSKALVESEFYKGLDPAHQKDLERLLADLGYGENGLSMVFPYMAPDNNNRFFGDQIAKFFIMNQTRGASKQSTWKAPK